MKELGVYDDEMDPTDPPLSIEVYAYLIRQMLAKYGIVLDSHLETLIQDRVDGNHCRCCWHFQHCSALIVQVVLYAIVLYKFIVIK